MKMEKIQIDIKKLGINGEGIGYINRKAIFVDGAIPSEKVEIVIDEDKEKYAVGHIVNFIKKSPFRVTPKCSVYDKCGGCTLQHIDYQKTLEYKKEIVSESFARYAKINPKSFEIKDTIGNDDPYHYRNKASVPIVYDGEKLRAGLYEINTKKIVFMDECIVHDKIINEVIDKVLNVLDKYQIKAFNPKYKNGVVKYIVCRVASNTVMVSLILNKEYDLSGIASDILGIDKVVSFYTCVSNDPTNHEIFAGDIKLIAGEKVIVETLGDKKFSLLPNAFFQLNSKQTIKLYDEIRKAAKLSKKEIVLDAYCGVGTISKWVSKLALEVIGIDNNKEAIINANANKEKNTRFICSDIKKIYPKLIKDDMEPDVVLVDPPRVGLGEDFIKLLLDSEPRRIVYTSCNPSTLAKDVNMLMSKYAIKYVQPVDMFPFTSHIESVCLLELKK